MATKAQCESALRIYKETLLAFKNVVDVGTAPLPEADSLPPDASATAISRAAGFAVVIHVSKKVPLEELEEDDVLPAFLQVRDATGLYKVPTRVIEIERS
jgi:hypothetical protein